MINYFIIIKILFIYYINLFEMCLIFKNQFSNVLKYKLKNTQILNPMKNFDEKLLTD